MRLILVASGAILIAGGLILLSFVSLGSGESFDFNEAGIWIVLLISIFPGVILVACGSLLKKAKKYGMFDFVILAGSLVMFFILTIVLMGPSG